MKTALLLSLERAMDNWIEDQSQEDAWPPMVAPPNLHELMARSAASVVDAIECAQAYGVSEGLLKQPA